MVPLARLNRLEYTCGETTSRRNMQCHRDKHNPGQSKIASLGTQCIHFLPVDNNSQSPNYAVPKSGSSAMRNLGDRRIATIGRGRPHRTATIFATETRSGQSHDRPNAQANVQLIPARPTTGGFHGACTLTPCGPTRRRPIIRGALHRSKTDRLVPGPGWTAQVQIPPEWGHTPI